MRRHDYQSRTDIEFGRATTAGSLSQEESKELREEMQHRHADPACAVAVEIETNRHSLEGIAEKWGLNYPHFHFEDGRRGFITPDEDEEELRLLFNPGYGDGRGGVPGYKYPIESVEVSIYWYRTPDCPQCGHDMTYGMCDWDRSGDEVYVSGWICEECMPARVEEGIR